MWWRTIVASGGPISMKAIGGTSTQVVPATSTRFYG
jgi:hypothetical protein